MFYLLSELHFLIHLTPLMHFYPCSYLLFFPFFLLIHLFIRDKKGESIPKCIVISICLMCTFVRGENHRGDAYTKRKKAFFLWENFVLFALCYACFLVILWCFQLLLVSMLCCSHRIVFVCWTCIHLYAIVLY